MRLYRLVETWSDQRVPPASIEDFANAEDARQYMLGRANPMITPQARRIDVRSDHVSIEYADGATLLIQIESYEYPGTDGR